MSVRIQQKIVKFSVHSREEAAAASQPPAPAVAEPVQQSLAFGIVDMHEQLDRPEILLGSTYKVKTPLSEHAMYITINDIVLNSGTPHEVRRPFEIFINSKNMDHFQWIVALTRIVSAVFRKGGDVTFLVEELRSVFDPRGGYFKRGGRYVPSLVAEIGDVIEAHLRAIGMLTDESDPQREAMLQAKRAEVTERLSLADDGYPDSATLCGRCHTRALVLMDGCLTCLSCGDSKCG